MLNRREFMKGLGIVGAGVAVFPKAALGEMVKEAPHWDAGDIQWAPGFETGGTEEVIYSGYNGKPCMVSVADNTISWNGEMFTQVSAGKTYYEPVPNVPLAFFMK